MTDKNLTEKPTTIKCPECGVISHGILPNGCPRCFKEKTENDKEYRKNLVQDLRTIHISAFINNEPMSAKEKKEMRRFVYETCVNAANEIEEVCESKPEPVDIKITTEDRVCIAGRWYAPVTEPEIPKPVNLSEIANYIYKNSSHDLEDIKAVVRAAYDHAGVQYYTLEKKS